MPQTHGLSNILLAVLRPTRCPGQGQQAPDPVQLSADNSSSQAQPLDKGGSFYDATGEGRLSRVRRRHAGHVRYRGTSRRVQQRNQELRGAVFLVCQKRFTLEPLPYLCSRFGGVTLVLPSTEHANVEIQHPAFTCLHEGVRNWPMFPLCFTFNRLQVWIHPPSRGTPPGKASEQRRG